MDRSLFNELHPSVIAAGVHKLINDPVDWDNAYCDPSYLDMVKVKYRTFQVEYPRKEIFCKLPSMFTEEFGSQMHKYNMLVDRFGNRFEVIVQERDGDLYLTHGWSQVKKCYVEGEFDGGWASLTFIRPRLFVLLLKDRFYRELMPKDTNSSLCFNLFRVLYGPDEISGCVQQERLPYRHDDGIFHESFHVFLTKADITSGYLIMRYEHFASKLFCRDASYVKLVDEEGLEWKCTLQYLPPPCNQVKLGGQWMVFLKTAGFGETTHLVFGTKEPGKGFFVKKFT